MKENPEFKNDIKIEVQIKGTEIYREDKQDDPMCIEIYIYLSKRKKQKNRITI